MEYSMDYSIDLAIQRLLPYSTRSQEDFATKIKQDCLLLLSIRQVIS